MQKIYVRYKWEIWDVIDCIHAGDVHAMLHGLTHHDHRSTMSKHDT